MKIETISFLVAVAAVSGTAQSEDFDYSRCASIRDVTVPYEIELHADTLQPGDVRFVSEQTLSLRIDENNQVYDADGRLYVLDSAIAGAFADQVRQFVAIGRRFALHYGDPGQFTESVQVPDPADLVDSGSDEDTLRLFADSCRNLYKLKTLQTTMAELIPAFEPVIIVDGFDEQTDLH